ncbi:MAG: polysaccharide export protein [Proteobacteria bacterium]|nr:polysaccharide export protein [Pseudomonadota bacterium]
MSTLKSYRRVLLILTIFFVSSLMGCGNKSAGNREIDRNNSLLQTGAATVSEIILGPGDVLNLTIWQNKDFNGSYKVDLDGNIFIPLVGPIKASGLSAHTLRSKIISALEKYIVDPQVQLAVTSYRSRKVYVLGEVNKPGIYQMDETLTTIIAALAAAGGFTEDASANSVVHIKEGFDKGDAEVLRMDSYLNNDHSHDGHLQNASLSGGDVIYVPSSFMANVDNFFEHIETIIRPIVGIERAIILEPLVVDILDGKTSDNNVVVTP